MTKTKSAAHEGFETLSLAREHRLPADHCPKTTS